MDVKYKEDMMRRGMKKVLTTMTTALGLTILTSFPTFAGQWQQDDSGWWWQNEDGSYPVGQWVWIDGNHDGDAENYYFNEKGYLVTNAEIQGMQVNEAGARVVNGAVCTTRMSAGRDWYPGKDLSGEAGGVCAEEEGTTVTIADIDFNDPGNVDAWWDQQEWETISGDMIIEDYRGERTEEDEMDEEMDINSSESSSMDMDIDPCELAEEILELVNKERVDRGCTLLVSFDDLTSSAILRAEELKESFSHFRPDGSYFNSAIIKDFRFNSGENIISARGFETNDIDSLAQLLVKKWMESPSHKKNLLNSKWGKTGIGVYTDGKTVYVSQLFAK